ncbi:hypothetical protein [Legionella maioricensis]|uniref:SidC homolog n=1 Tax=Legionella maioricensis TaxID=2896528 RepID=A0A9X2IC58_9GAMM|nr:hypothetical protein [Legionella maioricensis]MCL9684906.1 hypothetical protein [Legionella maioricensis]MCL9688262.1 hypothetical protein [Legionella maioricensis]
MTQEKIDYSIKDLAPDTKAEISNYINEEPSRSSFALSSRMFGLGEIQDNRIKTKLVQYMATGKLEMLVKLLAIRPDLRSAIQPLVQHALFKLAGFGEQDKMKLILESYPEFFYTYAPLKDISNVCPAINKGDCKGITVFQHAVWAGDVFYMCNMMLDCLPENEEGEKIRAELQRQYKELMEHGVVYEVDGKLHFEKQFSVQSLMGGLSQYVTNYESWAWKEREFHWCKDVGLLQNLLTAHFRHHYCDPEESFWNNPNFTKAKLTRTLVFNDVAKNEKQVWDDTVVDLGSKCAISSGPLGGAGNKFVGSSVAEHDLRALTTLHNVRTNIDLPDLVKRLNSPIQSQKEDYRPPA